jgi:DNA-binding transcriptional ArsR family regulator
VPFDSQEVHEVTDARALRAMAHPLRLALLEALAEAGELTASEAAERVRESPASCSFHLRQLAKYGFVEEAERGPGRRRPWRRTYVTMRFGVVHDDRETAAAAETLADVLRGRYLERVERAAARRHLDPPEWREVTGQSEFLLYVTPDELRAVDEEVTDVLRRFRDRIADRAARPDGARPIEVLLFAHPADL